MKISKQLKTIPKKSNLKATYLRLGGASVITLTFAPGMELIETSKEKRSSDPSTLPWTERMIFTDLPLLPSWSSGIFSDHLITLKTTYTTTPL